jgi:hypothetical protein
MRLSRWGAALIVLKQSSMPRLAERIWVADEPKYVANGRRLQPLNGGNIR